MSQRGKKPDDEMLITHLPPVEKDMAGRDDVTHAARPTTAGIDRASLGAELAAAPTELERRRIIQSIQERFGNEVAEEIVGEARLARLPGGESNGERLA
jgi:hypothetical protein